MHGLGVTEAVAEAVPESLVPVLVALTQLGDAWLLTAFVAFAYWHGPGRVLTDHRDGARLVAVAVAGFAAVTTLKFAVGHPRPGEGVALLAKEGFGLPSGHATGAAAVYVGAALLSTWRTRERRLALAGALVALVSFTRIALGVHFLLDVVAGALIGTAVAVAVSRVEPRVGFAAASLVAVAGVAVAPTATDTLAVAGVTVGAAGGWSAVEHYGLSLRRPPVGAVIAGVVAVGGLAVIALKVATAPPLVGVAAVGAGAGLIALPAVQNFSR